MNKKAFTAVELLITIGIITLISLVTLPSLLNYQKTVKLRNEARNLATNLRLAQQLSVTEQVVYQVTLLPLNNEYRVINSQDDHVVKDVDINPEVSITQISGFSDNIVRFNAAGGAIETGYIILSNTKNATSTIYIKPSGYVQIIER